MALHVHIHITSKNTDVRKLQALDALREANAAWHDRSFDVISRGSWGQGCDIFRQDVERMDGKVLKFGDISPVSTSYFRKTHDGCIILFSCAREG